MRDRPDAGTVTRTGRGAEGCAGTGAEGRDSRAGGATKVGGSGIGLRGGSGTLGGSAASSPGTRRGTGGAGVSGLNAAAPVTMPSNP